MRRLALPVTLALAVVTAGTLPAQERADRVNIYGSPAVAPSAAGSQPIIHDATPPTLPPIHNGEHGNGHNGHVEQANHEWGGVFGFAEFLILRPRWQNQDYAIIDPRQDLVPLGTTQSLSFDGRAGFRAGLGYQVPDSAWAITFTYTYLRSEAENGLVAPPGGNLFPTFTRPGLLDFVDQARAESRIRYNIFDLDFSRDIWADDCVAFRFLGGVRLASIDYAMNAFYDGIDAIRATAAISSD